MDEELENPVSEHRAAPQFQPQVCERCGRDRVDAANRCWCGAKWAEMLNAPQEAETPACGATEALASRAAAPQECDCSGMIEQFCRDLNAAHDEIVRLQGGDPAQFDWPEWSAPANSIRWAEKRLGRPLSKASLRAAAAGGARPLERHHTCGVCGWETDDMDALIAHVDTHGGAQPSAAPSEKPPAWSPLERFLLDRQAETRDPRYQDAAVSLYQQRTGWGAPKWPVRVPSAASREIQALREALQRWVDIDNAPDQIAAYLSVLADTKALLSSPANPPDIPDGSSE